MATKRPLERYRDILAACAAIFTYTEAYDEVRYLSDPKTRDAVERQVLKIAEAAAKLGQAAEADLPDQPWPRIRAIGNRLRHEYDNVDSDIVWALVAGGALAALRDAVAAHLAAAEGKPS